MVKVTDVTFGYSRKQLLFDGLTAQLSPGSIYGLLGRNGAGKTSLLKLIAGLRFPSAGQLTVLGQESRARPPSLLRLRTRSRSPWSRRLFFRPSQKARRVFFVVKTRAGMR